MANPEESFRLQVSKDYLKFSAAHFIAYPGFRERLHGHNYRVSVGVGGELTATGYVVDFGILKKVARRLCDRLDERVLVPALSDCLTVEERDDIVVLRYEHDEFQFPAGDTLLLPIVHSSVEELAQYLTGELETELGSEGIRTCRWIEVGVEETTGQAALYRRDYP